MGSNTITNVTVEEGAPSTGQAFEATSGIPNGTEITNVNGPVSGEYTLTLSAKATSGSSVKRALKAGKETVASVSGGTFVVGHAIEGAGVQASTTIASIGSGTLTLSKIPTNSGTAVPLAAGSKSVTRAGTTTGKLINGEQISGTGIQAGTTVSFVNEGAGTFTLSKVATTTGVSSDLEAALLYNANETVIREALEGLSTIGANNVRMRMTGSTVEVTFIGALSYTNLEQMTGTGVTVSTLEEGVPSAIDRFSSAGVFEQQRDFSGVEIFALAVSAATHNLLVADPLNKRILEWNPATEAVTTFSTGADTPGGSFSPLAVSAVAVDNYAASPNYGDVYVRDFGAVDRFNASGAYLCQITGKGEETSSASECDSSGPGVPGGFGETSAVAVDPSDGRLYVGDAGRHAIEEFEPSGAFLHEVPVSGTSPSYPAAVAVKASSGDVYVADPGQRRRRRLRACVHPQRHDGTRVRPRRDRRDPERRNRPGSLRGRQPGQILPLRMGRDIGVREHRRLPRQRGRQARDGVGTDHSARRRSRRHRRPQPGHGLPLPPGCRKRRRKGRAGKGRDLHRSRRSGDRRRTLDRSHQRRHGRGADQSLRLRNDLRSAVRRSGALRTCRRRSLRRRRYRAVRRRDPGRLRRPDL